MKSIFKNDLIVDNIKIIIQDNKFSVKKFWFKKVQLTDFIEIRPKIHQKTANKILEMYNDYHKKDLSLEDIFNTSGIIKYKNDLIEFRFSEDESNNFHFKFIERILSINQNLKTNILL